MMKLVDKTKRKFSNDYRVLVLALVIALLHGLIYVFLVPPWQHYDEPTHFEFSWLKAVNESQQTLKTPDQSIRRELAASMIEHNFFEKMSIRPNLLLNEDKIWIGVSQINNRQLYYILTGVLLRFISTSDVGFQLNVLRLFSSVMLLIIVASAWGIPREIVSQDHPLRWMLPFSVAMLPGFVDIMGAVNDDVGAATFFSLFLWSGCRLIVRGFSWPRVLVLILLTVLNFWVKNTVTITILIIFIPILLSIAKKSVRRIAWGFIGAGSLILLLSIISWGDSAYWIRFNAPDVPLRTSGSLIPLGNYSFRISGFADSPPNKLVQVIPKPIAQNLSGDTVSMGAWIWADKPGKARTPLLVADNNTYFKDVEVTENPTFFMYTASIEPGNSKMNVVLSPPSGSGYSSTIYYDGIILAEGKRPKKGIPTYDDIDGWTGQWGKGTFKNLIRNGSAESAWPWIRNWADRLFSENFPGRLPLLLAFLIDHGSASDYYMQAVKILYRSFWAGFGWGNIQLIGSQSVVILGIVTLFGLLGTFVRLIRNRKYLPWAVLIFLGSVTIIVCGSALMRGTSSIIDGRYLLPVARYIYPVIIPLMMILNLGWLEVAYWSDKIFKVPSILKIGLFWCFFVWLSVIGVMTITHFYY